MNNKDREHIGYLLSIAHNLEEFEQELFEYDKKIKEEYEAYVYIQGRSEKAEELFRERMSHKHGNMWSCLRDKSDYGPMLEAARREIYGDEYDFVFKK